MKKIFSFRNVTVFLLVVIIVLSSALVITSIKLKDSKNALAEQNKVNWNHLAVLTSQAESVTSKTKEELGKFTYYQNGVIYSAGFDLYPYYNLEGYGLQHFLTVYDQFLKDIQNSNLSEQRYNEALALYAEISKELNGLCKFALDCCEGDKTALLNLESKQAKEVNEKIKVLTKKYENKIYAFLD